LASDGLLLLDKAAGRSSFGAIAALRPALGRKLGHAGTLDPFATGLLVLLSGAATRLAPCFVGLDKRYVTEIDLTATTTTGDPEGEIVERHEPPDDLDAQLDALRGEVELPVPAHSAVKIDRTLPPEIAALFGCAVMTGVGAVVNTAQVRAGRSTAVFGLGGVGLSALLGAVLAGAHPIVAVDVVPAKLQLAQELGATAVVDARAPDTVDQVREATAGGAEYAFETVGSAKVLVKIYPGVFSQVVEGLDSMLHLPDG